MEDRVLMASTFAIGIVHVLQHTAIKILNSKSLHENIPRMSHIALDLLRSVEEGRGFYAWAVLLFLHKTEPSCFVQDSAPFKSIIEAAMVHS